MRVLFIPSWYPSPKNVLAGSFIEDLAQDLANKNIQITVVALHINYKTRQKSYVYTSKGNLTTHHFFGWAPPKVNKTFQDNWISRCVKLIESKINFEKFDAIHAHDYISLFLAAELSRRFGKTLLASLHHSDILLDIIPAWRKKLLQSDLSQCKVVIVPSTALKKATEVLTSTEINIIPNYIDRKKILVRTKLNKRPTKIISVGSLDAGKNHLLAIEFIKEKVKWSLDIYGDGPQKKNLQKYIQVNKLGERVTLKGSIKHDSMLETFVNYDALISTSKFETFGLSILEALSSGIPVICLNKYGPLDFVNNSNGIFIDNENKNPLDLLEQKYENYNAHSISDSILSQYELDIVIPQYLSLYKSII